MTSLLLYESASGYALFERVQSDEVGVTDESGQQAITNLSQFSKMVKLKSFLPFTSLEEALQNINSVSEGLLTAELHNFLEMNLPTKKKKFELGVVDPKIGNKISESLGIKVKSNEEVLELLRGIRLHFFHFVKSLEKGDLGKAQLGLSHGYSRSKVKFNIHRVDNMIIQAIAILDQLDKDLNTFCMRVREWYAYHFPELNELIKDNYQFAKIVTLIGNKGKLSEDKLLAITDILGDEEQAKQVLGAARMSMGAEMAEIDMEIVEHFAARVVALSEYRISLWRYLQKKMEDCAPNLASLIGDLVGARLIAHAGSLTNLAKYPASTVQILGAEKALFRALKTKGKTPKYGLIYHSSFIGQAGPKNKGRISRYVANKISLASRIDCFSDDLRSNLYGNEFKKQVEERLEFYKSGTTPRKNTAVMEEVSSKVKASADTTPSVDTTKKKKKKKDSKSKGETPTKAPAEEDSSEKVGKKRKLSKKKSKKEENASTDDSTPKKKKKKSEAADDTQPKKKKKKKVSKKDE